MVGRGDNEGEADSEGADKTVGGKVLEGEENGDWAPSWGLEDDGYEDLSSGGELKGYKDGNPVSMSILVGAVEGASVGVKLEASVGAKLGDFVGAFGLNGDSVGKTDESLGSSAMGSGGASVGSAVGSSVLGFGVGSSVVRLGVGSVVGSLAGACVKLAVSSFVGTCAGSYVSSFKGLSVGLSVGSPVSSFDGL